MSVWRQILFASLLVLLVCSPGLYAQTKQGGYGPIKTFPPNGQLNDWGNGGTYDPSYSHLYDNEAQYLDNGDLYGGGQLIPPGGDPQAPNGGEDPLNYIMVDPLGIPMGSGFNIVSGLVSYDHSHKGGTYWLAFDLPGPTNDKLSEGFPNRFHLPTLMYPLPFDADCNEDRLIIDNASIIGDIEDTNREIYQVGLWVGGNYEEGSNFTGDQEDSEFAPYNGPGFPIFIIMEEHRNIFEYFSFKAYVPAKYVLNSTENLDLTDIGGVSYAFHSDPANLAKNDYDIEVEVNGIWEVILPKIDQNALLEPVTIFDCYEAFVNFFADSNGDESDEEKVDVGIDVNILPMYTEVVKTVFCGECDEDPVSSTQGDKIAHALPGADVKFYLTITIPKASQDPNYPANGMGYIRGKDLLTEITANSFSGFWELCENEITVDGQTGVVAIPQFDIDGNEWVIKDASDPTQPYLFNPIASDDDIVVVIPFRVTTQDGFNTMMTPADIRNDIEVWGDSNGGPNDPKAPHVFDFARVNIMVSEMACDKTVQITDDNGVFVGPGTDLKVPLTFDFPLQVDWILKITNTGETQIHLDEDAITDEALCVIPDLASTPFCNGITVPPTDLNPLDDVEVPVQWIIDDKQEYLNAVAIMKQNGYGPGDAIWNQFSSKGTVNVEVSTPQGDIFICHVSGGEEVEARQVDCLSNEVVFRVDIPAEIMVSKTVSCYPESAADPKKAQVLPGADVIFTLTITNPGTALVDHEHTWFSDTLAGVPCSYTGDFQILTPGYTITPADFTPDGTLFEIRPALQIGESVSVAFRVETDPAYDTMNKDPECLNTLNGEADGPDDGSAVDPGATDQDMAEINIVVPSISCTKEVTVVTPDGTFGPAPSINNIPVTARYPWDVKWTIAVTNDGETVLDVTVTDDLIENYTGNDCALPLQWKLNPGEKKSVDCNENVFDFAENVYLDVNDADGPDDRVHNIAAGIGIAVDWDPSGGPYLCHTNDKNDVEAINLDDISCEADYNVPQIPAVIEVEKTVSCNPEPAGDPKLAETIPGADVYFKLVVTNPAGAPVPHVYTRFSDTLTGDACVYAGGFQITSGYTIDPPVFAPDGTVYEIMPPLDIGESVTMLFKVRTDPAYTTMGKSPECVNTLDGEADGPDSDSDPDDSDQDMAEVDILVPSILCTKEVSIETMDNSYGPAQSIPNIPRTDGYPWDVKWTLEVNNDGETYLDVTVTDALIEGTQNDCNLPRELKLMPGQIEVIDCTETVQVYADNVFLDELDGKKDDWVRNTAKGTFITVDPDAPSGAHICHTLNGVVVPAFYLEDISCDAEYFVAPPCGEIEIVGKGVDCDESGPFEDYREAVPDTWVYFKFTVKNPSDSVPLEHGYIFDALEGEWTDYQWMDGTPGSDDFVPNNLYDWGPFDPLEEKWILYRVKTDPDYKTMGVPEEIWNSLEAQADGPDANSNPDFEDDPQACTNAKATLTDGGVVNILVPHLKTEKYATVKDADGNTFGPGQVIDLPVNVKYPIDVIYSIKVMNDGEVDLPDVETSDQVLEDIYNDVPPLDVIDIDFLVPPGPPPWIEAIPQSGEMNPGPQATVTLDSFEEARILAEHDANTFTLEIIENEVFATQDTFDPDPICGPVEKFSSEPSNVIIRLVPGENIPTLDEYGMIILILVLAGLIVRRGMKGF